MPSGGHGPNVIAVAGRSMLLTSTSSGAAVHLATVADAPGRGREAVGENDVAKGYDAVALTAPLWSRTTLCGRVWAVMVGGDGGPVGRSRLVAFAPTCRRCLALIDRHFPAPERDSRLDLVAQVAANVVVERRGFAEIHDVPGDQQAELRKTVRGLIRVRTHHSVRTSVAEGVVYVECPAISGEHGRPDAAETVSWDAWGQ
ncbi:hypothetical protein [Cryptosporangium phraense]|uniref:Uncharacterized protein n=1 Tax=Cryptosporangium phraense TaxID=2593070 RepID=A0A545AGK4_9ACTN|nr:hypothetical protein [Cryptosporangium phraense]TQS40434.1 hypothetical protein FL583_34900 [Cryptosporangium phraense]